MPSSLSLLALIVLTATDGGAKLSTEEQSAVNDILEELGRRGLEQSPRPLDNPALFGDFEVAFSSTQRARQSGQPAGGRFRGKLARSILKTTKLCQSVFRPDLVTNKVEFLLCGVLKGSVGLRGRLQPTGDDKATVKVQFEPPRLVLGSCVDLPIGPRSSVVLTTTYLTDTVRLGRGSRGSLFVFTKGGAAESADMENVGLGRTVGIGWVWLLGVLGGLCTAALWLWTRSNVGKAVAALPSLAFLLLAKAATQDLFAGRRPTGASQA